MAAGVAPASPAGATRRGGSRGGSSRARPRAGPGRRRSCRLPLPLFVQKSAIDRRGTAGRPHPTGRFPRAIDAWHRPGWGQRRGAYRLRRRIARRRARATVGRPVGTTNRQRRSTRDGPRDRRDQRQARDDVRRRAAPLAQARRRAGRAGHRRRGHGRGRPRLRRRVAEADIYVLRTARLRDSCRMGT